jgi:hypothetical protein
MFENKPLEMIQTPVSLPFNTGYSNYTGTKVVFRNVGNYVEARNIAMRDNKDRARLYDFVCEK